MLAISLNLLMAFSSKNLAILPFTHSSVNANQGIHFDQ
jgi:hypothetical protein